MFVTRNVARKYMAPAGDDGSDAGGGGGAGDDAAKAAADAAAEAAKAAAGDKKPSDEEARLLKENMSKKAQLVKAAEATAALEAKLKAFEGIDPEAVRKLLGDQKDAEAKQLEAKGDWDRLKTRMAEEHGKETTSLKAQLAELQASLGQASGVINDLSIGTKFGQSAFIADELTLTPGKARVIYGDHFDLVAGEVVGYDKPRSAANRTALVDQYGSAVGFDAALRKIVEADPEKDHLLKSKVKAGAGSESKKMTGVPTKDAGGGDSVSKISAGLKGLNFKTQ